MQWRRLPLLSYLGNVHQLEPYKVSQERYIVICNRKQTSWYAIMQYAVTLATSSLSWQPSSIQAIQGCSGNKRLNQRRHEWQICQKPCFFNKVWNHHSTQGFMWYFVNLSFFGCLSSKRKLCQTNSLTLYIYRILSL